MCHKNLSLHNLVNMLLKCKYTFLPSIWTNHNTFPPKNDANIVSTFFCSQKLHADLDDFLCTLS